METEQLADRIVILDQGKVIFQDSPKKLKSKFKEKNIENAIKKAVEKR